MTRGESGGEIPLSDVVSTTRPHQRGRLTASCRSASPRSRSCSRDLDVAGLALGTAPPATTQPLQRHDPALHVEHVLPPACAADDRHADETGRRRIHAAGERATLDARARVTRVTKATKRRASDHRPPASSYSTLASAWFSRADDQQRPGVHRQFDLRQRDLHLCAREARPVDHQHHEQEAAERR